MKKRLAIKTMPMSAPPRCPVYRDADHESRELAPNAVSAQVLLSGLVVWQRAGADQKPRTI